MADMTNKYILALDQGTQSARSIIFDFRGDLVTVAQQEVVLRTPAEGFCESTASDLWSTACSVIRTSIESLSALRPGAEIVCAGITNQRESVIAWDSETGEPLTPAILWLDTRCQQQVDNYKSTFGTRDFQHKTGLTPATYFSCFKIKWMLENVPAVVRARDRGTLQVGTVDCFLVHKLTAGARYLIEVTNASRTGLMDINTCCWDNDLCNQFGIPVTCLPEITPSAFDYGQIVTPSLASGIRLTGILGDQQASLFGHQAWTSGGKATIGTGAFLLATTGRPVRSEHGLLTTVAYGLPNETIYALEGSVAVAGVAFRWLRDQACIIGDYTEIGSLAKDVTDSDDCYFVPAFSGLLAPHWRSDARGTLVGLKLTTTRAHIVHATINAIVHQLEDVLASMHADQGRPAAAPRDPLAVDGGVAANNDVLLQILANVTGQAIRRPQMAEVTALGAAMIAALGAGACTGFEDLRNRFKVLEDVTVFRPDPHFDVEAAREGWKKALEKAVSWNF